MSDTHQTAVETLRTGRLSIIQYHIIVLVLESLQEAFMNVFYYHGQGVGLVLQ